MKYKYGSGDIDRQRRQEDMSFLYATLCSDLGPVVQSIVSLTSSLRGQLVKRFTTL